MTNIDLTERGLERFICQDLNGKLDVCEEAAILSGNSEKLASIDESSKLEFLDDHFD